MANKKIKQDDLLNTLFFQVPKWLMDMFLKKQITQGGFKTYVLMYDRLKLSSYNNWVDKEGDVYIKYSYDELQEDLGCSRQAVSDNLKNLVKLDLVDKIKGFNTSSKFYLKIFTSKENLTSDSLENLTNSSKENLTTSSLENLDSNNNNYIHNKSINNNSNKNKVIEEIEIKKPITKRSIKTSIKNINLLKDSCIKYLTQEQIEKLEEMFPGIDYVFYIEKIKSYAEEKGKVYKDYYRTILNWARKDVLRNGSYDKKLKHKKEKEEIIATYDAL